jgi:hypothetical protein
MRKVADVDELLMSEDSTLHAGNRKHSNTQFSRVTDLLYQTAACMEYAGDSCR